MKNMHLSATPEVDVVPASPQNSQQKQHDVPLLASRRGLPLASVDRDSVISMRAHSAGSPTLSARSAMSDVSAMSGISGMSGMSGLSGLSSMSGLSGMLEDGNSDTDYELGSAKTLSRESSPTVGGRPGTLASLNHASSVASLGKDACFGAGNPVALGNGVEAGAGASGIGAGGGAGLGGFNFSSTAESSPEVPRYEPPALSRQAKSRARSQQVRRGSVLDQGLGNSWKRKSDCGPDSILRGSIESLETLDVPSSTRPWSAREPELQPLGTNKTRSRTVGGVVRTKQTVERSLTAVRRRNSVKAPSGFLPNLSSAQLLL